MYPVVLYVVDVSYFLSVFLCVQSSLMWPMEPSFVSVDVYPALFDVEGGPWFGFLLRLA